MGAISRFCYLHEPGEDEIEQTVGLGILAEGVGWRLKEGEGISGASGETGKVLVIDDYVRLAAPIGDLQVRRDQEHHRHSALLGDPGHGHDRPRLPDGLAAHLGTRADGCAEPICRVGFSPWTMHASLPNPGAGTSLALLSAMGEMLTAPTTEREIVDLVACGLGEIYLAETTSIALLDEEHAFAQVRALC